MKATLLVLTALVATANIAKADSFDDFVARQQAQHLQEALIVGGAIAHRLHVQPSDVSYDESANEYNVGDLNCYNLGLTRRWEQIACRPAADHTVFGRIILDDVALTKILRIKR